jgi:hypothetical protein
MRFTQTSVPTCAQPIVCDASVSALYLAARAAIVMGGGDLPDNQQ